MTITMEQALASPEFHDEAARPCDSPNGPVRWRRNGKTQTWKTRPDHFRVPVKHGLYTYGQIWNGSSERMHALEDCPVPVTGDYRNHVVGCLADYEHPGSCKDAERSTIYNHPVVADLVETVLGGS